MKFSNKPTVVAKSNIRKPAAPVKKTMVDNPVDAEFAEMRAAAIASATGNRLTPEKEVTTAELLSNTAAVKPAAPLHSEIRARAENNLGPEWIRQDLPSNCVPYDFDEIFIRPLTTTALSKLSAAAKNKSYTMLVDALDSCISVDARLLTPEDFSFLQFWIRMNSYPSAPIEIPWVSKYGNECSQKILKTDLEIIDLQMTKAEFETEWKPLGLAFPTVRDVEVQSTQEIAEEDAWRIEMSQYIALQKPFNAKTYIQDKMDAFEALGVGVQEHIQRFSSLIAHGVKETAEVYDRNFTPEGAIAFWRKTADELEVVITTILQRSDDQGHEVAVLALADRITGMRNQADEMEERMKQVAEGKAKKITADKEVITVSINVMHFFPYS